MAISPLKENGYQPFERELTSPNKFSFQLIVAQYIPVFKLYSLQARLLLGPLKQLQGKDNTYQYQTVQVLFVLYSREICKHNIFS